MRFRWGRFASGGRQDGAIRSETLLALRPSQDPIRLPSVNPNDRHDRHDDHWGGDKDCRMTSVSPVSVPTAFGNQASGGGEESDNAGN